MRRGGWVCAELSQHKRCSRQEVGQSKLGRHVKRKKESEKKVRTGCQKGLVGAICVMENPSVFGASCVETSPSSGGEGGIIGALSPAL